MSMRRVLITLIALAPAAPIAAQAQPNLDLKVPPSPAVWRDDEGALTHLASGLSCPATVGDLKRMGVLVYDGLGLNVSCSFEGPGMAATVYAVAGDQAERDFQASKAAIEMRKADAPKLIAEDKSSRAGLEWRRAAYGFANGGISEVWVAQAPKWVVKYRLTYRAAEPAPEPAPIKQLNDIVATSMAPNSMACAKTPPAVRKGKLGEMGAGMLKASVAGAFMEASMTLNPPPSGPPRFCVDQVGQLNGKTVLLLRGVSQAGGDAYVDRATMAGSDVVVTTRWNGGMTLEGEKDPTFKGPYWAITTWDRDKVKAYGAFNGRPDLKLLGIMLQGAVSGELPALHTFDPKTQKIEGVGVKK